MPFWSGLPVLVALLCLCLAGCTALRKDRTEFGSEPPLGGGVVPIGKRYSVVLDEVKGTSNGEPYEAAAETRQRFAEMLRTSLVFQKVYPRDAADIPPDAGHVSIDTSYDIEPHDVANFFRALLVGAIGYRLDIEGSLTVSVRLAPDAEPIVHQSSTQATRIYYSSGRAGEARTILLREVEAANRSRMQTALRLDPHLIASHGGATVEIETKPQSGKETTEP